MGISDLVSRVFGFGPRKVGTLAEQAACFREILQANNAALGVITRIQEALSASGPLSAATSLGLVASVSVQTYRMIRGLATATGNRYPDLLPRFETIRQALRHQIEAAAPVLADVGLTVPLGSLGAAQAAVVGQKSAYLGEAQRILPGCVPMGFALSAEAYQAFMGSGGLGERVAEILGGANLADTPELFRACARIDTLIQSAPVPSTIHDAIRQALAGLPNASEMRFAVRSSALQEGGLELSFAGQYRSLLNVLPDAIPEAFKQVVASKFSPEAVVYRLARGIDDTEVAMCCCVLAMVPAATAGVMYSSCHTHWGPRTLIHAVLGLGTVAVDGSVEPDTYVVNPKQQRLEEHRAGRQATQVDCLPEGGTRRRTTSLSHQPPLVDEQALRLAQLAWKLEKALRMPIEVEWAIDQGGHAWVLQVRPQPEHRLVSTVRPNPVPGFEVLVDGGSPASAGVATGRVHQVASDLDLLRCPVEAILVSADANPRLAVLLPRAKALISDSGEVTGHLATVARELRIPAILATRTATQRLRPDTTVTVDANAARVYAGIVPEILAAAAPLSDHPRDLNRERLAAAAAYIVPLTLHHRLASGFSPKKCKTLHDLIRFCHQATIETMFEAGDQTLRQGGVAWRLATAGRLDCRVIDLGGGVRTPTNTTELTIDDILCVPLRALWNGLTDPRLQANKARPLSVRGFVSSMMSFGFDEDARVRDLGEPSFAFVTRDYLNLNSRIGYHFATVDARLAPEPSGSFLSFRFVGGSTGVDQRQRRARLVERILGKHGFETDRRVDLVNARLRNVSLPEGEQKAWLLGVLIEYVNHLDMALVSDAIADQYEAAFLAGDFAFGREDHA